MIQKTTAMGNWLLAPLSQPCIFSFIMSPAEFFVETSNLPGNQVPFQPRFGVLKLLAFPKTKITFEREEISDCQWDSGKYNRWWLGESCKIPRCLLWRGLRRHCPLYLVSSCIFFNKCLYFSYYMVGYLLNRPPRVYPCHLTYILKV